jgi:type III restriction enzyme
MKLILKGFQEDAVRELYRFARAASRDVADGDQQALILAAPTGSGKTVVANALFERIIEGDEDHEGDPKATFLWITDQPELNEQTRRKFLANSTPTIFSKSRLISIEAEFDEPRFAPGHVYFLNTQKIGRDKKLVTPGDKTFTFWETVSRTVQESPSSFWVVIDEAHRGMNPEDDPEQAATIVQKFILGSAGEIPSVPLILGVSATPQRFQALLADKPRMTRPHVIAPDQVRSSGLIKDWITVFHPNASQPSDWTLLGAATRKLAEYEDAWADYCEAENETAFVEPLLVVQIEDAPANGGISKTDLAEAIRVIEKQLGRTLAENEMAHCLQEGAALEFGDRVIPFVKPPDIQERSEIRVVFFKMSLNTGWDCPRAEVMMSFRRAVDYTHIAQLVGRMVRTPLARRISGDESLNSVALYLPYYDEESLDRVVGYLESGDPAVGLPSRVRRGEYLIEVKRDPKLKKIFEFTSHIPTYSVERIPKVSAVKRLARLGRYLAQDKIDAKADATLRAFIVKLIEKERNRLKRTKAYQNVVAQAAQVSVRQVQIAVGGALAVTPAAADADGNNGSTTNNATAVALDVAEQNLDDIFDSCGRQLGEGLHVDYVRSRAAATTAPSPTEAKLELFAVLNDTKAAENLEAACQKKFSELYDKHRIAIGDRPDGRREVYRKLIRSARIPEAETLELPPNMFVDKREKKRDKHLYIDGSGKYAAKLNAWEEKELGRALGSKGAVAWLRNIPRQAWSFTIPYRHFGEVKPHYPDFLVFRKVANKTTVDILEPHASAFEDSWAKAVGLAEFARDHGDKYFGKIELVTKVGSAMKRLDLNNPAVRAKVLSVQTNQQLQQVFEGA